MGGDYLKRLQADLKKAMASEDFEECARLRDLIRAEGEDMGTVVPGWEQLADELRIRLMATIKGATIHSIYDMANLCNCAQTLFLLHKEGQRVDAADEDDTATEGESTS